MHYFFHLSQQVTCDFFFQGSIHLYSTSWVACMVTMIPLQCISIKQGSKQLRIVVCISILMVLSASRKIQFNPKQPLSCQMRLSAECVWDWYYWPNHCCHFHHFQICKLFPQFFSTYHIIQFH